MTIPKYVMDAAKEVEVKSGVSMTTLLDFYQCAERHRKHAVKQQSLAMEDEYSFERWWELYDKKVGKDKCMEKWLRMTPDERKSAIERIPAYVAATPNIRFRKNPLSWLNQKCWNDEVLQEELEEANAEKFMEYFNNLMAGTDVPQLTVMDEQRRRLLNIIYTHRKYDIPKVLDKVRDSTRLTNTSRNGKRCTFEFIFNEENFLRILEGYYDD